MTQIGSVYAEALYGLAREEGLSEIILKEMQTLQEAFAANADFLRLLSAPNIGKEERVRILDDSFSGRVQPYVLNFLKILTEKGYARRFSDCCDAYRELYNNDNGILPVKAVTTVEMNAAQREKLAAKLERITGKRIELKNVVDPACMGGVRLDYDGKRVDDTVKSRLDAVRGLLKNTML